MKLLYIYIFTTLFSHIHASPIPTKRLCKDCRHFIGDKQECRMFLDTNLVTGDITYHSARSVRGNEEKCGKYAVYYEENQFKVFTVPYYIFKSNLDIIALNILIAIYFCAAIYRLDK